MLSVVPPLRFVLRGTMLLVLAVLATAALAQSAQAVPPGQNGAIVVGTLFGGGSDTYLMGPNGEDPGPLGVDGRVSAVHPSGKSIAVKRTGSSARELYDLEGNLIRGLATKPISDFSPDGTLATSSTLGLDQRLTVLDLETNVATPIGPENSGGGLFTPDGNGIIFHREWRPSPSTLQGFISRMNVDGSGQTDLLDVSTNLGMSVSPDGTKVAFTRPSNRVWNGNIWVMGIDGSDPTPITNASVPTTYYFPRFSPDGTKILAVKSFYEFGGANYDELVVMDIAGGGERTIATGAEIPGDNWVPFWVPVASTLDLKLEARRVDDGDNVFDVVMRLRAGNQSAVENLRFTDPTIIESSAAGFPEDERSDVVKISGPDKPIPSRLEVNQESTHVWTYEVNKPGRVALYSEVTARAEKDGIDETDGATVIANSIPIDPETDGEISPELAALGAMDTWLVEAYDAWMDGNEAEARRLVKWAKKKLSAKERKVWLGSKKKLVVSPSEEAFSDRANISPRLAAVLLPDRRIARKVGLKQAIPSEREIAAAFFRGYTDAIVRNGKRDIGAGWKKVKGGFITSVAIFNYLNGEASPEERAQVEAMAMNTWSHRVPTRPRSTTTAPKENGSSPATDTACTRTTSGYRSPPSARKTSTRCGTTSRFRPKTSRPSSSRRRSRRRTSTRATTSSRRSESTET